MENCIFCKIVNKEIPTIPVYEDDNYLAFNDIHPKAPVHLLIIPKKHLDSFHSVSNIWDREIFKWLYDVAWKIIEEKWLKWCQLHINSWSDHGQEVMHIHLHLLSDWINSIKW